MVESVWDYPRPPRVEPLTSRARVLVGGLVLAESDRALRVLETSHPPGIYFPPDDVRSDLLRPASGRSVCEWKGTASYLDVVIGERQIAGAAWTYRRPDPAYASLRDHLAFYPGRVDACYIGDERVTAQPGDFYGGWITSGIRGPFKGNPGTSHW